MSETEPPGPPAGPPPEDPSDPQRAQSHRAAPAVPFLGRFIAPLTAVVVVVIVVVLLIWINGSSPGDDTGGSVAATTSPTPTAANGGASSSPRHHHRTPGHGGRHSAKPTPSASVSPAPPKPAKTPKPSPSSSVSTSAVPTAMAPVQVLNNSRITGLAHEVAAQVAAKGWTISFIGNLQGLVPVSTVYYAPGDESAAEHLEHDFSSIARIEPNEEGRIQASGLTLVVTRDWVG